EARKWKANIELEMQQAAERRAEELKRLEHSRAAARVSGTGRREEELAESRHQVDIDRIRGEMEIGQVERRRRIALVEAEMEKSRLDDKEARDRRGAEWQLERWQKIRSIKDAAA